MGDRQPHGKAIGLVFCVRMGNAGRARLPNNIPAMRNVAEHTFPPPTHAQPKPGSHQPTYLFTFDYMSVPTMCYVLLHVFRHNGLCGMCSCYFTSSLHASLQASPHVPRMSSYMMLYGVGLRLAFMFSACLCIPHAS